MERYVKELIESLKTDLLKNIMECRKKIPTNSVTEESAVYIFEGSLITLKKFGMISSDELISEKYKFSSFIQTPFDIKAIHFLFSIKRNELLLHFDVVNESGQSITLFSNTGALLDEVYQNGLLTYMLYDMSEEDWKSYKYSSVEKMAEQEQNYFKDEKPIILTVHSANEGNSIKCLPPGNYILQIQA